MKNFCFLPDFSIVARVPRVGAGGNPHQNLLSILGLQPTSVEFYRRHGVGKEYLWNYGAFTGAPGRPLMVVLRQQAANLLRQLALGFTQPPKLFNLASFEKQEVITDPLVADIPASESEKLSEDRGLEPLYEVPDPDSPGDALKTNYIGWLVYSDFDDLKHQRFNGQIGTPPRPLLYRMLRGALLLAYFEAAMRLYETYKGLPPEALREVELSNIRTDRTVTRWEFMEADVCELFPELLQEEDCQEPKSVGRYLQTEAGLSQPEAKDLRELLAALKVLIDLPTARLERLFVEHLDLCSYRLDAWQTACFYRRLQPPPPVITSFGAIPDTIQPGDNSLLSWNVTGPIDSLILEPGPGDVTGHSSLSVSPPTSTTYTLTARNRGGSTTAQVRVTVKKPPVIESFTADPDTIKSGDRTVLSWSIMGPVENLNLEPDPGDVTGHSSATVSPTTTTVYTLTATNSDGSNAAQVTVTVIAPPVIEKFDVEHLENGISELSWTVRNADRLMLKPGPFIEPGGCDQPEPCDVTGRSSALVSPNSSTTYTLTASNRVETVEKTVRILIVE